MTINESIRRGHAGVVIDLEALEFVDSSGMALLLNAARQMGRRRRPLAIAVRRGPVRRSLELARVDRVLPLADGLAAALAAARPSPAPRQPA